MAEKPLSLKRKEFMEKAVNLVNESGLPFFVIEPILSELLSVVKVESEKQYQREKEVYEEVLKKEAEKAKQEEMKDAIEATTEAVPV